jgi:hypothetical protein
MMASRFARLLTGGFRLRISLEGFQFISELVVCIGFGGVEANRLPEGSLGLVVPLQSAQNCPS